MEGIEAYKINPPAIPSGSMYLFVTDSGVEYEVRFGRKQNNILAATIVFGVLNEEFDGDDAGEYVVVNRGEIYRVMATVARVIQMHVEQHPRMISYEFTGENRQHEGDGMTVATARTKFFLRYIPQIFGPKWKANLTGNTATVLKRRRA